MSHPAGTIAPSGLDREPTRRCPWRYPRPRWPKRNFRGSARIGAGEHVGRAGRVHAAGKGVAEAIKWQRLTFTVDGNWHHWLCAIAVTKGAVSLVFHKGSLLGDPAGMLQGDGRYLRQVPYDRAAADPGAVTALVRQAIARQTDMLDGAT